MTEATSPTSRSAARRRYVRRRLTLLACVLLGSWRLPAEWCRWGHERWAGDTDVVHRELGRHVAAWTERELVSADFATASTRFDGEWSFGSYMMAGMGLGQLALAEPDPVAREPWMRGVRRCIERMLAPEVTAFDRDAWGEDAFASLDGPRGHAACLGYANLVLGIDRLLDPRSPHAALHDRVTAALVRRLAASPIKLLQTYPLETYPVDNCAVVGSIALHATATGTAEHKDLLATWCRELEGRCVDPASGLLVQAVLARTGGPLDHPRGSGTALGAYFLSFVDWEVSRRLWDAVRARQYGELLGFGLVREYPPDVDGAGDIDSGPVILGYGVSATGFALAGARQHGDRDAFGRLLATAVLYGAPRAAGPGQHGFVTGGPLGNAILLAMLTAPRAPLRPDGAR